MAVMSAPDVAEPVIHQSVFQRRARNRNLQRNSPLAGTDMWGATMV